MSDAEQLQQIREQIDALDAQMLDLLNQRARAALEVARIKQAAGEDVQFYRPEREAQVLRRIKRMNQGPISGEQAARLFREVMSVCLALEEPLRIAYLGPEGTFTQAAALKHFGHAVHTEPMGAIPDVFVEVESGNCNFGVVPVENSTEGVITHTLDQFIKSPLQICGEVSLRINQHLMSLADELSQIRTVYSHQQSLAQCRGWLDRHLPNVERIAVGSNAEAARLAREDASTAAIAGSAAAELYGLAMLDRNIEDEPGNTTRFLIIGRQQVPPSGDDKTSLMLSTRNEAGGLYRLLAPLAENGISMTRIESRPSRQGNWDYLFFVDIDGHAEDTRVKQALDQLARTANLCKVLGSYPRAVL